jgi:hypothetical protein
MNEKRGKMENKNHSFKQEPRRARGGFGPLFPLQISTKYTTKIQIM